MYKLNTEAFHKALRNKGFSSLEKLAQSLKLHRNTIHHYLSGSRVFPEGLEKIICALELTPHDAFIETGEEDSIPKTISDLIDKLHTEFPNVTFILFGSRTQGRAHKYSDWDIGIYSINGIEHSIHRKILRRRDELAEDLPFNIDLVNLNRANSSFLHEASRGWQFLTGKLNDWNELKRKARSI